MATPVKPRLFVDADVLIAASASTTGASHVLLRLSDLTVIQCIISKQVTIEAERNLQRKLPQALPLFRLLIASAVEQVDDPSAADLLPFAAHAETKDVPILAAACLHNCHYLVTFNVRHFFPPTQTITVLRPGEFLLRLREQLEQLIPFTQSPPPRR